MDFKRAARLLSQLPEDSRVAKKIHPENEWGWKEVLLNRVVHELKVLQWQKTEDATKRNPSNYPELWLPDFIKDATPEQENDVAVHDIDEIKDILSRPRIDVTISSNEQES